MKRRLKYIILLILPVWYSCNAQEIVSKIDRIPNGKWVSVQDSLNSIIVKGCYIYEYYNNRLIDTTKYTIIKESCDPLYESAGHETLFLLWDQELCYEVIGITDRYIELIYTANGKTITFWKR